MYNAIYYLIVDEQTCTASNLLEDNLPHDVLKQQLERLCCIHLRNHWYHPKLHITFKFFLIWMPYGDHVPFILYGMVWASMIHDMGERIFGDLVFFLPLEGNIIAAQDQQILYTYNKWREGKCGVGYFVYHVKLFNPPTLQEPKVEDDFHELPFWRVAHCVWMIAWGWRIHMGMMVPHALHTGKILRMENYLEV